MISVASEFAGGTVAGQAAVSHSEGRSPFTLRDRGSLKRVTRTAATKCPSLAGRRVSPHTVRHATAMHLLQSGVDITLIALWLGHESPATTHIYVEADLKMKEAALKVLTPPALKQVRYRPPDSLLGFLQGL